MVRGYEGVSARNDGRKPGQQQGFPGWVFLVLLGILVWAIWGRASSERLADGAPIPPTTYHSETGELITVGQEFTEAYYLAFWATWCPACRAEIPGLSRVHARLQSQGSGVLALSVDELPPDTLARRARELGARYPVGLVSSETAEAWGVRSLPTLFLVSGEGRILRSWVGRVAEESMLRWVTEARE